MEPIPFKQQNRLLGAGDNPNTVGMPIAVSRTPDTPFRNHTVSCWKLTPEEIAEITCTGVLWVSNMAWPPPPVQIMAYDPFVYYSFTPLPV